MPFADALPISTMTLQPRASQSIAAMTAANPTNGNRFLANRNTILRVRNTSGGTVTVTIRVAGQRFGLAVADVTFTVPPTTGDVIWTGFDRIHHHNRAKEAWVTFSSTAGVSLQVIQPL